MFEFPSFTLLKSKMAIQEKYHVDQKITYNNPCINVSELKSNTFRSDGKT